MNDIQAHLEKIRSDAAECALLGNLVTDGKREVFARAAEHLNALASAVEKTIATAGADMVPAAIRERPVVADNAAADHHQQAARPRRILPWLAIVSGVVIGAFFWADYPGKQHWSLANLLSKQDPLPAPRDETRQAIATLLAGEQGERKELMEQLGVLAAHMGNLERALDNLKTARAEIAAPSNKDPYGTAEKPATAETKPSPPEEQPVRSEQNRTSAPDSPAAARQSDGIPTAAGSPPVEPVDQVGSITVAPRRAEINPRKPDVGPPGCTQFRSFDPLSGTYTTFEGRRRPCR
jgi:BA14K-like protein